MAENEKVEQVVENTPVADTETAPKPAAEAAPAAAAATTTPTQSDNRPAPTGRTEGNRPPYRNQGGPRPRRRKVCQFCVDRNGEIDYKDAVKLRKFMSERAKIIPRRVTGTCARHQRELTVAIKRSRQIALLPYVSD